MKAKNSQIIIERKMLVMGVNTFQNKARKDLDPLEVECLLIAQQLADAGKYTMRKLFGVYWENVRSTRSFGRRLKQAVLSGAVPGLVLWGKNSSKSLVYEVIGDDANTMS